MNMAKKVWSIVSTVLVVLIVLCAIFLVGARVLGYRAYNVVSGSMEPTYSVGDLLYIKEVDVNTIKVGDPITFLLNDELAVATHRVVRVDAENQHFYTQGDSNTTEDTGFVHFKNVIGVPQFSIPLLGYVSDFVQNPPGMYITIGGFALLIVLAFLPDLLRKKRAKAEEKASVGNEEASEEKEPEAPDQT